MSVLDITEIRTRRTSERQSASERQSVRAAPRIVLCSCYFASAGGRAGSATTRVLTHVMGERSWIETPDSDRSEGLSVRSRAGTRLLHANSRCSPYETIFIHNLCALLLLLLTLLLVRVRRCYCILFRWIGAAWLRDCVAGYVIVGWPKYQPLRAGYGRPAITSDLRV